MKAVVTGSSGFVGRHLVPHLRASGDDVVTIDHNGTPPIDVTDAAEVRAVLQAARPDAVYHLAALSHVGRSWDAPETVFRVNALGALNVLRACADAGAGRVLVAGSADVYGAVAEGDLPLTEDAPIRPITPYGASKAAADVLALQAFLGDGLPTLRVRAFNHTGPGQSSSMLVPGLARRIAEAERSGGSKIGVGNLDVVRDLCDVRDVVRAYRLLVERGEPGEAYNVCSGRGVSVRDVAGMLLSLSDAPLELVVDPDLVRHVDVPRLVGSASRLHGATGWTPEIALETTLADVLTDVRASG
ncbi:MAG TPA: GDP-mannose 4,6-dehydratase [Acidimicrobiia bacterium]|nr:GDP-mannose 4,6-dehydratase [Acidimicrobiia bacterium]